MRGRVFQYGRPGGKVSWYFVADLGIDPATGKRKQKKQGGFARRRDAENALSEFISTVRTGTVADDQGLTVEQYLVDWWLPSVKQRLKQTTFDSYVDAVEGRIVPRVGGARLSQLKPKHVDDLLADLAENGSRDPKRGSGLSARTVRTTGRILKSALADAVKQGLIARNPFDVVSLPKVTNPEMDCWDVDEARYFLQCVADEPDAVLWKLLLLGGMRRGEALGLQWKDVDFDAGRVSIVRTVVESNYQVVISEPKTARSRRTIAVDPSLVADLRKHRTEQSKQRLALGMRASNRSDWIFSTVEGDVLQPQSVSQRFDRLVRKHGLRRIRFHDLRHTSATLLLASDVPLKVVSERLGHSSVSITADVYQHVVRGMDEAAAETLGRMLG